MSFVFCKILKIKLLVMTNTFCSDCFAGLMPDGLKGFINVT